MKRYNQKLTEQDILKMFNTRSTITIFEICDTYNVSAYRAKIVLSGMNLKITNYGFKL